MPLICGPKYGNLNDAVYQWFRKMREEHGEFPIVESLICKKALEIAAKLNMSEFKASKGWFRSWKGRYSISLYKVNVIRDAANSYIGVWRS